MKQWYSAQELDTLAPALGKERAVQYRATREGWQSRPRPGRAKEKEYAFSSLPTGVQAALALRWWATEVEDGPMQKARDSQSSHIQHAWASYALLKNPAKPRHSTAWLH